MRKFIYIMVLAFPSFLFGQDRIQLIPGNQLKDTISFGGQGNDFITYTLNVEEDDFALLLRLGNAAADLDLYLNYGAEVMAYDQATYSSAGLEYHEEILVTRFSDPPLQTGTYYVEVAQSNPGFPEIKGQILRESGFLLDVTTYKTNNLKTLYPGRIEEHKIGKEEGYFKIFKLDIPDGENYLRVELMDCVDDLDFYINYGRPARDLDDADYILDTLLAREHFVYDQDTPLLSGPYFITVIDPMLSPRGSDFSIRTSFRPERRIESLPKLKGGAVSSLEDAAFATVEIVSETNRGSGCLISSSGHILTNFHVVQAPDGAPYDSLFISVSRDLSIPPTETFTAEVLQSDEELDFAVLKITGDFYSNPLPENYNFPYYKIGDSGKLFLGDTLHFMGYPGVGGQGSRVSLSYTRGFVSGFEKTPFGTIIKSDGEINSGNSGGAAFNSEYKLIGLPTSIVSEEGGHLAYIHPVSLIPLSWFEQME